MYNGMLNIRKEPGYTSADVVAKLRGILHMRRIGHTGTLDPAAEGVLPVCLGSATKLCDHIADRDKVYETVMRLGVTTDTEDMTGQILTEMSGGEVRRRVTEEALRETVQSFAGDYAQIPPMYSAIKVGGKKLYELARAGRTVERKPRNVRILAIEVTEVSLPLVRMTVTCSKGTYIRSLCRDIGEQLGTGAAMESLLRTRVGIFGIEEALRLGELEERMRTDPELVREAVIPVDAFFAEAPAVTAAEDAMKYLRNGNALFPDQVTGENGEWPAGTPGTRARVYGAEGVFYAVYQWDDSGKLVPVQMFLPKE